MTEPTKTLRDEIIGGPEAKQAWGLAINALHAYAQASGCPPGGDVVAWFSKKTRAIIDAERQARKERSHD
jgi:hypothetical protein